MGLFVIVSNERLAPDVQIQPEVNLHHWRVVERGDGALHLSTQMPTGPFRRVGPLGEPTRI